MEEFPLGFTKCPKCQKYSINMRPTPTPLDTERVQGIQIIDWECPYCFSVYAQNELEKNIIEELEEELEKNQQGFQLGQLLSHSPGEISPQKAAELAADYIQSIKTEFPPSFENFKLNDRGEEWEVDFKKIPPKGITVFPDNYCIIVNKKTGQTQKISEIK
jgi:hypothetical protein